jgi:hypothetical protein
VVKEEPDQSESPTITLTMFQIQTHQVRTRKSTVVARSNQSKWNENADVRQNDEFHKQKDGVNMINGVTLALRVIV